MYNNHTQGSYKKDIMTFSDWSSFIKSGRNKTVRTCANNTQVRLLDDGGIAIKLHHTDIVTITKDNTYILNSGGWQTVTTKERINRYSPAGISQRAGIWYMSDGSLFYDGMEVNSQGLPLKPKATGKYESEIKTIKKQAREYAKGYVEALQAGLVGMPSGGDCWYCLMFDKDGSAPAGHIRTHIDDKYYVPSLLVNAGRSAGYRDDQIGLMGIGGQRVYINPENNIYKYIVKRLQAELRGN
jgi:hypothetical protein